MPRHAQTGAQAWPASPICSHSVHVATSRRNAGQGPNAHARGRARVRCRLWCNRASPEATDDGDPMAIDTERGSMTGDEIVALTKRHTLFEWSAQSKVDPIPVAGAKGCYFWTPEGKRYLDFNSQLMCTNVGHGHPTVIAGIQKQAETLAYANPFMATAPRAR